MKIVILGSTGSIGTQTLSLLDARFEVVGLAAGENAALLAEQIAKFRPRYAYLKNAAKAAELAARFPDTHVLTGEAELLALARLAEAEIIVNALVGIAGILPTYEAVKAGKTVLLANKESLVAAGDFIMPLARPGQLVPLDSEHNALWQLLVHKPVTVTITGSGGSLRDLTRAELAGVTREQVLNHPNWRMGAKITVDSATLANKGFEIIEAHHLFNLPYAQIKVVIERTSTVHALAQLADGAVVAYLGQPDMRLPLAYSLFGRAEPLPLPAVDLLQIKELKFTEPDLERYPLLAAARAAGEAGGFRPAIFLAANEAAVALFLAGVMPFSEIEPFILTALAEEEITAGDIYELTSAIKTLEKKLKQRYNIDRS